MAIYLVRHGETAGNAGRVVQVPGTPLSEVGRDQAERLGRRLAGEGIRAVLSSDLARAAMTAEAVSRATGAPVSAEPLLQERDFGDVRGTPYAELESRGVQLFAPDYAPPGGETWEVFHDRVERAWARVREVAAATDGHLAVVTHGLVCHRIVSILGLDPSPGGLPAGVFRNTALTVLHGPPWRADPLGCVAHLAGPGAAAPGGAV